MREQFVSANEYKITYHCDVNFTPEEREDLQFVADKFAKQTNGFITIHYIYDVFQKHFNWDIINSHHNQIMKINQLQYKLSELYDEDNEDVLGFAIGTIQEGLPTKIYFIVETFDADLRKSLFMHEIGHTLGMQHIMDETAIMYPFATNIVNACLTWQDLNELCRVLHGCKLKNFKPCDRFYSYKIGKSKYSDY